MARNVLGVENMIEEEVRVEKGEGRGESDGIRSSDGPSPAKYAGSG